LVIDPLEQITAASSPRAFPLSTEDARGIAGAERLPRAVKNWQINTGQEV